MESRQLRYFVAVAEQGSFTAAAKEIGVAQPALSAQIGKLEADLGCLLFSRHARGITLTPAGRHLMGEAKAIANHLSRAAIETRHIGGVQTLDCTIGLPPYAASILAVPLMDAVAKTLPAVKLHILDALGGTLREWYSAGRLDVAVIYRVPNEPLLRAKPIITEDLVVATKRGQAQSAGRRIGIDQILSLPLIVATAPNAHRQLLDAAAFQREKLLRIAAEIDSLNSQRELVVSGVGAVVAPLSDFATWPRDQIDLIPVRSEEMVATLQIVCGNHAREDPAVRSLESLVTSLAHRLVAEGKWPGAHLPKELHESLVFEIA